MSTEIKTDEVNSEPQKSIIKKRDVFRFKGERDMAINLEHVTNIFYEKNKITFEFYTTSKFIDFENDESALRAYEQIIGVWSADVGN